MEEALDEVSVLDDDGGGVVVLEAASDEVRLKPSGPLGIPVAVAWTEITDDKL